jgi:hypothetical protein
VAGSAERPVRVHRDWRERAGVADAFVEEPVRVQRVPVRPAAWVLALRLTAQTGTLHWMRRIPRERGAVLSDFD